jgi:SAM-dependent methyltransferase
MAHTSQMLFFEHVVDVFPTHFEGRVIDIGSLDINGGPHTLFTASQYVGVDLGMGRNVTHVGRGEELAFPDNYFDVAMSSECFEHNQEWRATLSNMIRMTREGGLILFSTASTGRAEHGTTRSDSGVAAPLAVDLGQEWYQNLTVRMVKRTIADKEFASHFCVDVRDTADLLFLGIKKSALRADVNHIQAIESTWNRIAQSSSFPGGPMRRAVLGVTGDRGLRVFKKIKETTRGKATR